MLAAKKPIEKFYGGEVESIEMHVDRGPAPANRGAVAVNATPVYDSQLHRTAHTSHAAFNARCTCIYIVRGIYRTVAAYAIGAC